MAVPSREAAFASVVGRLASVTVLVVPPMVSLTAGLLDVSLGKGVSAPDRYPWDNVAPVPPVSFNRLAVSPAETVTLLPNPPGTTTSWLAIVVTRVPLKAAPPPGAPRIAACKTLAASGSVVGLDAKTALRGPSEPMVNRTSGEAGRLGKVERSPEMRLLTDRAGNVSGSATVISAG